MKTILAVATLQASDVRGPWVITGPSLYTTDLASERDAIALLARAGWRPLPPMGGGAEGSRLFWKLVEVEALENLRAAKDAHDYAHASMVDALQRLGAAIGGDEKLRATSLLVTRAQCLDQTKRALELAYEAMRRQDVDLEAAANDKAA